MLAPLGATATLAIVVAIAYLSLAALGYVVFLLGTRWFSWPVGLAAAAFVLSRYEILSYGVRAYVDIPYVVLVLAALAIESRRRRAGLAGPRAARARRPAAPGGVALRRRLLAATCGRRGRRASARCSRCAVAAAPVLWVISDARDHRPSAVVADQHAQRPRKTLDRATGHPQRPLLRRAPARRGARARRPRRRRDRRAPLAVAGARARAARRRGRASLAVVALAIVAAAGLPIQDRYVFLSRRSCAVFAGAGLAGWCALAAGHPRRRLWRAASVLVAIAVLASLAVADPALQQDLLLHEARRPVALRAAADRRTTSISADATRSARVCGADRVPYATPVPLLALELHVSPAEIVVGARSTAAPIVIAGEPRRCTASTSSTRTTTRSAPAASRPASA